VTDCDEDQEITRHSGAPEPAVAAVDVATQLSAEISEVPDEKVCFQGNGNPRQPKVREKSGSDIAWVRRSLAILQLSAKCQRILLSAP
jgi:hypothetical protein